MSLNSINTNQAAYVALQSLNATTSALQATQKQISTGYRVSDATDDGGAAPAQAGGQRVEVGEREGDGPALHRLPRKRATAGKALHDLDPRLARTVQGGEHPPGASL